MINRGRPESELNCWDGEDGDTEWRAKSVGLKASLKRAHLHKARHDSGTGPYCYGKAGVFTARSTVSSKLFSLLFLVIPKVDFVVPICPFIDSEPVNASSFQPQPCRQ